MERSILRMCVVFGALAVAACAPRALASAPVPLAEPSTAALPPAVPGVPRPAPPPPSGTTAETWDPALGAALAELSIQRTAANHRAVAVQYARLKIRDMAHQHFSSAIALDPTDAAAYDGRARLWREFGFPGGGLADAYRARYYAPASAEAPNTIGTLFEAMGKFDEALMWYTRAAALDSKASFPLTNICHLQMARGWTSAVMACERALEAEPSSGVALNNLAMAYAVSGDFDRARARFAAAGDEAQAAYNMGIVFMAARRFDDAEREFRAAWRARPSMTLASERLRQTIALKQHSN